MVAFDAIATCVSAASVIVLQLATRLFSCAFTAYAVLNAVYETISSAFSSFSASSVY